MTYLNYVEFDGCCNSVVQYHSFVEFVRVTHEGYWSVALGIAASFPGFSMAIFWDCLHMVGIFFPMKHLLRIASSHLWALGPILFSCSTKTSSLTCSGFIVFSKDTHFL